MALGTVYFSFTGDTIKMMIISSRYFFLVVFLLATIVLCTIHVYIKNLQLYTEIEAVAVTNIPNNNHINMLPGIVGQTVNPPHYSFGTSNLLPSDLPLNINFADNTDPFRPGIDVPFYWRITKSASTATIGYLMICLDLVVASQKGANVALQEGELRIISEGDSRFVNVDVTTISGIERAEQQGLVTMPMLNFIVSGRLIEAADHIFTPNHRGRLFSIFRHPVERMVSMKEYLATAHWERKYNPQLVNMTMEEYIQNTNNPPMNNPVTRQLVNKQAKHIPLVPQDLVVAKEILRTKCLVGLVDHLEESVLRFQLFFGWEAKQRRWNGKEIPYEECKQEYLVNGRNRNPHYEKLEPNSATWKMLLTFHEFDVALYHYAVELFHEQSYLFPSLAHR